MDRDIGCSCLSEPFELCDCGRRGCLRRRSNANTSGIHGDDYQGTAPLPTEDRPLLSAADVGRGLYVGLGSDRARADGQRKGDWMQTYTGRQFWPLDPRPDEIDIIDIAAALSKLCRYGGHTLRFYSVAEHCVLMARMARMRGQSRAAVIWALMHDASEGYLCDVIRPIKPSLTNYAAIEGRLIRAIAARFGLPQPMPPIVNIMDEAILLDEQAQVMARPPKPWSLDPATRPLGVTLQFWSPDQAFAAFMQEFAACGGRAV